jgi:hypothetical protein
MKNKPGFMFMGFAMMVISFAYLFAVTFMPVPDKNVQVMLLVVGYVSGILTCIVTYFFGASFAPKPIQKPDANENDKKDVGTVPSDIPAGTDGGDEADNAGNDDDDPSKG